jgi:hypothetical protein
MNNSRKIIAFASVALYFSAALSFAANSERVAIINGFGGEAGTPLSADSGKSLFEAKVGSGKPETPSCTTCHSASPLNAGQTRAGKPIEPMAVSKTPDRFTDLEKVTKWFRRNCNSVLGRECTPQEKGDFLTFMTNQ